MSNLITYIFELRKKEKIFTQQKNEDTISSSSFASIQSRINPHFLYNTLNSIASLAHTEPQKTEEMALELARFYEKCTDKKADLLIPLRDELSILDSYLKIEKIRFGGRLQVSLPTDEEIMVYLVPSFILQPIVENAIKYGYHSMKTSLKILISASTNLDILTIRIYDSGSAIF
ncbi:MAG: histidine kinase [Saprospiraceae bacterium]|nr:histidine kinase [Saprospiraceae bacterium]